MLSVSVCAWEVTVGAFAPVCVCVTMSISRENVCVPSSLSLSHTQRLAAQNIREIKCLDGWLPRCLRLDSERVTFERDTLRETHTVPQAFTVFSVFAVSYNELGALHEPLALRHIPAA